MNKLRITYDKYGTVDQKEIAEKIEGFTTEYIDKCMTVTQEYEISDIHYVMMSMLYSGILSEQVKESYKNIFGKELNENESKI